LRQHVETHQLVLTNISNNPQEIRFTVSIGVASLDEGISDCQAFIQNVDTALYRAKQQGRNRTFIFEVKESKSTSNVEPHQAG
jgi:diguanylate cyclase (GGDEF)-like protein